VLRIWPGDTVRTWTVEKKPQVLATYGTLQGPSVQTGPIH